MNFQNDQMLRQPREVVSHHLDLSGLVGRPGESQCHAEAVGLLDPLCSASGWTSQHQECRRFAGLERRAPQEVLRTAQTLLQLARNGLSLPDLTVAIGEQVQGSARSETGHLGVESASVIEIPAAEPEDSLK